MKPFRRAVIHIGTERTGSTSVQRALFTHRREVADAGVFVPLSLMRSYERDSRTANHVLFVMALADLERFPADLVPIDLAALQLTPGALQQRILDGMRSEFTAPASGAQTVLISAEHIHSRLDTQAEVARVREVLEPFVEEFLVVVILRPQIEMAVSLANLVIRRGGQEPRLIPLFDDEGGYDRVMGVRRSYFELDEMLGRFEAVFGKASIHAYRYDSRGEFDSRAVLFEAAGVPAPRLRPEDRANASISGDALQVLRCVHQNIDLVPNPDWRPSFIDDVDRILVRQYPGQGLRPGREASVQFMEQFAAANERLRQRYFPESTSMFDVDFARYPVQPDTMGDIPEWARVYVNVLAQTWLR